MYEAFAVIGMVATLVGIGYGIIMLITFVAKKDLELLKNTQDIKYLTKCEDINNELLMSYNNRLIELESWYVSQRGKNE